jgi:hypothetical protein
MGIEGGFSGSTRIYRALYGEAFGSPALTLLLVLPWI